MIYNQSGRRAYGVKNFVFDTYDDMLKEDNANKGDSAFIIETSQYYMLNHKKEWIEIFPYGANGGSGGGGSEDGDEIIYDGGAVSQ